MTITDQIITDTRININTILSMVTDTGINIDIGCGWPDSTPSLTLERIYASKLSLLFDPRTDLVPYNETAYKDKSNVQYSQSLVLPCNIEDTLIKPLGEFKNDVFVLDVDIDGYDFYLTQAILEAGIRPIFLSLEVNEKIPPPIKFSVLYNEKYNGPTGHFYGMSISKAYELVEYGYDLIQLFFASVILIRRDKNPYYTDNVAYKRFKPRTPEELYQKQYLENNLHELVDYNSDVIHWHTLTGNDLKESINDFYAEYDGKYKLYI